MHVQFLAAQNTMAALIGGMAVHHWGAIPVIIQTTLDKLTHTSNDGDIDALFLRVLSCRFLVLDESSTCSLTLLGLLDSFSTKIMRTASIRGPWP